MTPTADRIIIDESHMLKPRKPVYRLWWLDAALAAAEDVEQVADYERIREFPHRGAAIAWSRRQLYAGAVFGDVVEMFEFWRGDEDYVEGSARSAALISLDGFQRQNLKYQFNGPFQDHLPVYFIGAKSLKCPTPEY